MGIIRFILPLLLAWSAYGAYPAYNNFNTNQFTTPSYAVVVKSGAYLTNTYVYSNLVVNSRTRSVHVGVEAGDYANSQESVAIGYLSGQQATSSVYSILIGDQAGRFSASANQSIVIGHLAGRYSTNTTSSISIGTSASEYAPEIDFTVHIGDQAGKFANGDGNVMVGYLSGAEGTNVDNSVFVGRSSGQYAELADNSTFLGRNSGAYATNATNSVFIGYNSGTNRANTLWIDTQASGPDGSYAPLIYGEFDNRALRVNGSLTVTNPSASGAPNTFGASSNVFNSPVVVPANSVTASNFVHSTWKWVDALATGSAIFGNPSGDPPQFLEVPGQSYFGYGYFFDDKGYFVVQGAHKLASTNSTHPNLWFEPHCHVMTTNVTAGTNASFGLELYYGSVLGYLTNYYASTNSTTLTNTYRHYVISFGNVTNNALSGRASVLWKGRIIRVNGGSGDIGATSPVWVDSVDVHIPVTELGTIGQTGD